MVSLRGGILVYISLWWIAGVWLPLVNIWWIFCFLLWHEFDFCFFWDCPELSELVYPRDAGVELLPGSLDPRDQRWPRQTPSASAALPTGAATHQYPATIVPGPHPQRAGKHVTRWKILSSKHRFSPTFYGPSCVKSWHRLHIFVSISERGRMGKTWVGVRKVSKGWHSTSERDGEDGSRRWLLLWEEIISPGDTGNLSPSHSLQISPEKRWQIWFRKEDKYIWTPHSLRRQDPNNTSEPGRSVKIISRHFSHPIIWNFTDI